MGILDRLFRGKTENNKDITRMDSMTTEPVTVNKEIDSIINILKNLGLLDEKSIERRLNDNNIPYDPSILKRMRITQDKDKFSLLNKYYKNLNIGYGNITINNIRNLLLDIATTKEKEGKNKHEVVEELITYAKEKVGDYENILTTLNEVIRRLEKNIDNRADLIVMMDFWLNNYKEEKLGYPINLDDKIKEMAKELKTLPYGGYGTSEIDKFIEEANIIKKEAEENQEESNYTLSRIKNTLFNPKRNRYLADVEALQRKITLINESTAIDDSQKKENVKKTIAEFNKMNGHTKSTPVTEEKKEIEEKQDNSVFLVEVNVERLVNLENGGYGPSAILKYRKLCQRIMDSNLSESNKYVQINANAELLIENYYENLERFNLWKQEQLEKKTISEQELDDQIKYMLSLSQVELNNYLLEDSRKKKEATDKHNYEVAFKYLAKKEAKEKNDTNIYVERMIELEKGLHPYKKEDIDKVYTDLLVESLTNDNTEIEFIDAVEYIDSTLIHQIYKERENLRVK